MRLLEGLTIDPRVNDDCAAFWELQLCNGGLHILVLQRLALDGDDFLAVQGAVNIRAESNIRLYL